MSNEKDQVDVLSQRVSTLVDEIVIIKSEMEYLKKKIASDMSLVAEQLKKNG